MDDKRINSLSEKLFKGTITTDERIELEAWYADMGDGIAEIDSQKDKSTFEEHLFSLISVQSNLKGRQHRPVLKYASIAAALILGMSVAGYLFLKNSDHNSGSSSKQLTAKVEPGGNKALLKLSNGQVLNLSDSQKGKLLTGGREVINKTSDGRIIYKPLTGNKEDLGMNTLTTPRGGKFSIQLPDGTLVMLDAASSISYPAQFNGRERRVSITGQVYFDVVHHSAQPFVVQAGNQVIKDIGTHFNISAYREDKTVKTTLEEGKVSVSQNGNTVFLKPGQTALGDPASARIKIEPADLEETLAWKNGYFRFNNEPIESIMPKISRWYNVDIQYSGKLPADGFNGTISRSKSIEKVLSMLQRTGVIHFKVEGRNVTVTP
jgi:transmembrane sensor